jgi:antitoxin (DNA-binding transcriptional repressor) of toxin-antitoxin stability system
MRTVGVRELKNRLSQYLRMVRHGEDLLVTDRGEVVAELRRPGSHRTDYGHPVLEDLARKGAVRLGAPNDPSLYPALSRLLQRRQIAKLLDEERGER